MNNEKLPPPVETGTHTADHSPHRESRALSTAERELDAAFDEPGKSTVEERLIDSVANILIWAIQTHLRLAAWQEKTGAANLTKSDDNLTEQAGEADHSRRAEMPPNEKLANDILRNLERSGWVAIKDVRDIADMVANICETLEKHAPEGRDAIQLRDHLVCKHGFDQTEEPITAWKGNLAIYLAVQEALREVRKKCERGDPFCPCQDGDTCHYEGENPMPKPHPASPEPRPAPPPLEGK